MAHSSDLLPYGEQLVYADIAEQALEGLIPAAQYRKVDVAHCVVPGSDIIAEDGTPVGQLLFGEIFDVLFRRAGRAYGRARRDGTVGWIADDRLKAGGLLAAYRVNSLNAALPFNALVSGDEGVEAKDLVAVGRFETDLADVAARFTGHAVKPGTRGLDGVDGVGMVQQSLMACGYPAPRRAADLERIGQSIEMSAARRGDIVVWTREGQPYGGHAAIMIDERHVVHASPVSGVVQNEQLADVAAGLSLDGYDAPVFRRLEI